MNRQQSLSWMVSFDAQCKACQKASNAGNSLQPSDHTPLHIQTMVETLLYSHSSQVLVYRHACRGNGFQSLYLGEDCKAGCQY